MYYDGTGYRVMSLQALLCLPFQNKQQQLLQNTSPSLTWAHTAIVPAQTSQISNTDHPFPVQNVLVSEK